ncbi:hypothetical protein EON76_01065 [bacterium]|nr:MAG: hypothetical protein EON76_01065 [bacterium]
MKIFHTVSLYVLATAASAATIAVLLSAPTHALSLEPLGTALQEILGVNTTKTQEPTQPAKSSTTANQANTADQSVAQRPSVAPSTDTNNVAKVTPVVSQQATTSTRPPAQSAVTNVDPVQPTTTDTAPIIKQLAAQQTRQISAAANYPSLRIDEGKRDQLYAIAASVTLVGLSLYAMTVVRLSQNTAVASRRPLYIK